MSGLNIRSKFLLAHRGGAQLRMVEDPDLADTFLAGVE